MSNQQNEVFWINDPLILIDKDSWYKIIPVSNMTTNEILNAITRFCLVLLIIFLIFCDNPTFVYILLIIILAILIFYFIQNDKNQYILVKPQTEKFEDKLSRKEKIADNNDFYNEKYSKDNNPFSKKWQRQVYKSHPTMPHDQTDFAKWLYRLPKTCKEDTGQCLRYEDIRYNRIGFESESVQKKYGEKDNE